MTYCTKDECEYKNEHDKCVRASGECIYDIDKETLGDKRYHELVDEGRMR